MRKNRIALLALILMLMPGTGNVLAAESGNGSSAGTAAAETVTAVPAAEETTGTGASAETEAAAEEQPVVITAEMMIPQDEISVLVLADSELHSLLSLDQEKIGVQLRVDKVNTEKTIELLEGLNGKDLNSVEYPGVGDQVQALYDREVDAILFSETYRQMIEEEYPDLEDETRVVYTFGYDIVAEEDQEAADQPKINLSVDPFLVYFSGIDTYGSTSARGRSDVNIIAAVNPSTRQVLLLSTPRDYYVELPIADNAMDKLTHAGVYGVDASIETLEQLYDIEISYYVRLNFSGFIDIIDALGGVDVYSDQAFTGEVYDVEFVQGMNHVDGRQALSFVRERHSFADGDHQRQRNQFALVKAVMDKVLSPAILMNYSKLLETIPKAFSTDMTFEELTTLIGVYIFGGDWHMVSYRVTGTAARRTTYSMGNRSLYVELEDEESIGYAKELMRMVLEGETLPEAPEDND